MILYYAGGHQWWCKRCKTTVRADSDGKGYCACKVEYVDVPYATGVRREKVTASPWEPVRCRTCVRWGRSSGKRFGFGRQQLPLSYETRYWLTVFGRTVEFFTPGERVHPGAKK